MHRGLNAAGATGQQRVVSQHICSRLPSPHGPRPTAYSSGIQPPAIPQQPCGMQQLHPSNRLTTGYAAVAQQLSKSISGHLPTSATSQPPTASSHTARPPGAAAVSTDNSAPAAVAATAAAGTQAVAIDVEYSHLLLTDCRKVAVPAWVAVVDAECKLLLKSYIRPDLPNIKCSYGGVPYSDCRSAAPLSQVQQQLQTLLANKTLIGHGLAKDLAALRVQHPQGLRYDTITYPGFCNRAGNARSLRQLAKQFLGLEIQQRPRQMQQQQQQQQVSGARARSKRTGAGRQQQQQGVQRVQHDPEEDAIAVMKLYKQIVLPSTYEGQVASATNQLMQEIQKRQQQLAQQQDTTDCD